MFRDVVVPLLATYALFLGVVAYAWRHPVPRPGRGGRAGSTGRAGPAGRAQLVGGVLLTVACGYVIFLAIVDRKSVV